MSATEGYRILDEPRPGRLAQLAVDPMWPLFGFMFGGAAFAWAWFVVNGLALGSPTQRREGALVAAGVAGVFALGLGLFWLIGAGHLPQGGVAYALLAVTVWKLGVSYWLYTLQSRSFDLYEYYGGAVRNGVVFVFVGVFAQRSLLELSDHGLWKLLVS
jgi:hypothetical protein